jgi:hypothetical protein
MPFMAKPLPELLPWDGTKWDPLTTDNVKLQKEQ